jgi:type I restriction enzyme S subunit
MNLSDIADVNPATDMSSLLPTDLVSFVPMSDLSEFGRWVGNDVRELASLRNGYTSFCEGDVLFAKITPCMENGKGCKASGLINGVGFGSTEFHVLRAKPGVDSNYLFQWTKFRELRARAAKAMTGSAGQQRVPAEFLLQYPITNHSSDEQTAIGHVLALVDQAIEQTEGLLVKLRRVHAGLTRDLLTRGLDGQGRLRSSSTHLFKPSALGPIPEDWDVVPVETLCSDIVDCPHSTPSYVPSGIPCIRTADMLPGELLLDQAFRVTETTFRERVARLRPQSGDIIYSREGERLGIASPVRDEPVCLGQRVMLLRPAAETGPRYLLWALNDPLFYRRVNAGLGATTSPHINVGDIRKALILRPPSYEQQLIGGILAAQDGLRLTNKALLVKFTRVRSGLMHDLLTGQVSIAPLLPARS